MAYVASSRFLWISIWKKLSYPYAFFAELEDHLTLSSTSDV